MQHASEPCPIAGLLEFVQDRWSFLILRDAFYGVRRFDAFRRHLGISRKVLAARLQTMVEAGLFRKTPYQQRPLRHEYLLTAKGRDLMPVLLAMIGWSRRWLDGAAKDALRLQHTDCGHVMTPLMHCSECGEPLSFGHVRPLAGPNAPLEAVQSLRDAVRQSSRPHRVPHD